MTLRVHGRTVREDGREVATLTFAGRLVTVYRSDGAVAGRLFRQTDGTTSLYDAWTALHPATVTPTDRLLAEDLPMEDAIGVVLGQEGAQA